MATNFPTTLDTYSAHADGVGETIAAAHINALQDAVAALEAKVGANSSAVTSSLDYKVAHPSGGGGNSLDLPPTVGVNTMPRASAVTSNAAMSAGRVYLTGFVPQASFTAGHIRTAGTGATVPTTAFIGLYSIDASGNATLISTSATTPALGATGALTTTLLTPVALTAGSAYAVGILSTGAALQFSGASLTSQPLCALNLQPYVFAFTGSGLTVLSASIAVGSVTISTTPFYAEVIV